MMNIRELLFHQNPYDNFIPNPDSQLNGWNSRHPRLAELIADTNPRLILEIGSWLGASALFMAENTDAHILCLDTWLGALEMWDDRFGPERKEALRLKNGYPTIYQEFLSNVVRARKQDQITPMPMPSSIGLRLLSGWNISPDLIYIDASHEKADVMQDIRLSMALRPRIICGDDYHNWEGVRKAVNECLPDAHKRVDGFWWVDTHNRVSSPAIE